MSKLLEIKDLYGGYEKGVKVLQGINLSVEQGEAVGIIGLNGSGKSTLGKAVMNLLPYRSGRIIFEGQDVSEDSTCQLAQKGLAMMHQGGVVFPNLSVWQNLQLAFGTSRVSPLTSQLSDFIPLLQQPKKKLMRTMADKLSGGQRHELALAMTLARKPKLVILDEPSAGLSPKALEETYVILDRIKQQYKINFILIEQNISRAVAFCNRCEMIVFGENRFVFKGDDNTVENIDRILFNK